VTVQVQEATKFLRIAPGQKDLKEAAPIPFSSLQPADRILVHGKLADDGKSLIALSIIAMKRADIAEKQAHEREEWQKHAVAGLVSSVEPAANTINVALPSLADKKKVVIHLSKGTILRRYAPDSVKFDDARPAPLDQIKPGDQLRARGTRSADGSELTADEIVSGTFRNIAGAVSSIDASAGTVTVQDLAANKPVTVKINSDSQLRKLPPFIAQRIAMRLKGVSGDGQPAGDAGSPSATNPNPNPNAAQGSRSDASPAGGFGGIGRPGGGGPPDLQQAIDRMPPAALAELQKGDAVMIVATEKGPNGLPMVITLLGGVEPILEASPKSNASSILSPWSLSSLPSGEAATP